MIIFKQLSIFMNSKNIINHIISMYLNPLAPLFDEIL